ncbi:polysaccharide deacetylase family protein [Paenibacillus wynnii]|uniref:polysaccharide deacetylase family protein n=1 Tax=Paenibacillus wynnii TaxID=268407 RepID=UPI002794C06E|nr:polysaccharide deacetylase family protein [Paenibacillus wynnii]MDQ0194239.1 peptidoglycan/xylan/chitin deacetylase (PgdA/CDA1 family) [Paenibacillus wynnii]
MNLQGGTGMSIGLVKKVALLLLLSFIISGFPAPSSEAIPVTSKGSILLSKQQNKMNKKRLTMSQLIRKYPETFKTGGPRIKSVALTFDDVPDPRFTPQLLDVLRKNQVRATFFVVGSRAKKHPDLVARIVREGHIIGNHSYNHPQFRKLRMKEFKAQILRTENIIQNIVGYKPKLIRPPYGEITEQQLEWAKSHGYKVVNWNVDSQDWKGLPKGEVKANILSAAGKGAIILQHGGGGPSSHLEGSIQALPEVIANLKQRGYTFVTVPQLLHVSKSK